MTNLNNLTKLIHKAVPSILDLKFGCKVSTYSVGMLGHSASKFYYRVVEEQSIKKDIYSTLFKCSCVGFQTDGQGFVEKDKYPDFIEIYVDTFRKEYEPKSYIYKDSLEILGRDITLEDVLVVMEKHYGSMWTHSGGVNIHILDIIKNKWKLNTPLHLQEQATIDFIYKLLK